MSEGTFRFEGKVEAGVDGHAFVSVPAHVTAAIGESGQVPIIAFLNDFETESVLQPRSSGGHALSLNRRIRDTAGIFIGDRVAVEFAVDRRHRGLAVPDDFAMALRGSPEAQAAFEHSPFASKKAYLEYLEAAPDQGSRAERISEAIKHLVQAHRDG